MKARDFDQEFDAREDVTAHLNLSKARRPCQGPRRVHVGFPAWMIESLDREAQRLGMTRQSIITVWIAERLERKASRGRYLAGGGALTVEAAQPGGAASAAMNSGTARNERLPPR